MTDRVENNLFKPNLPADNNATNNPPKTVGLGDSLMAAGQLLAGAGVRDSVVRAAYNNAGGCFGFGFGVGGNFFPVPGLDATDIWARTNLANLFNDVCNIYKGCGNISGTNTNGVTSDATAAEKTKNPADPFSKLDYEQVKEMAAKEQEIADKEKALQEEKDKKDAGDKERIKTLSKELYDLRKEYEKKDRELGGGSELSKSFGGKGKFYRNISEGEFTQIQDFNNEIKEMKDELQKLEDEGSKLAAEYTKVQQQLVSAGKASDNQSVLNAMSESSRERFAKVKDEREEKIKEIADKIKDLKTCIEKASTTPEGEDVDFYTHIEEKAVNDKAAAKKAAGNNISKTIADKMHNADGTLKTKEDIKSEIEAIGEKGKFSDAEIEAVLDRIYAVAEGKNKEELKAALGDEKFFDDIYATQGLLNNPKELLLLQKTYDSLVGAGKFNENGKKYLGNVNGQPYWKHVIAAIKKGQKEIDAPIASAKGVVKSAAGSEVSAPVKKPTADVTLNPREKAVIDTEAKASEAEQAATAKDASPEQKAAAEKARQKADFVRKMSEYGTDEISAAKDKLAGPNKLAAMREMDDALFVLVFAESSNAEAIKDSCYEPTWNEYQNMQEFCARMNEICAKYEIADRVCVDQNGMNTVEFKNPVNDDDVTEITHSSSYDDFKDAACSSTIVGTYKDHTFAPLNEAARRIMSTVR
ncbi:MAG: hypothetical protein K6A44_02280 [bacterium]|nr:hypothetical protein [bacterium]